MDTFEKKQKKTKNFHVKLNAYSVVDIQHLLLTAQSNKHCYAKCSNCLADARLSQTVLQYV